jgi:hypothetical protein
MFVASTTSTALVPANEQRLAVFRKSRGQVGAPSLSPPPNIMLPCGTRLLGNSGGSRLTSECLADGVHGRFQSFEVSRSRAVGAGTGMDEDE